LIKFNVTGSLARITLNRPKKRNAIDEQMIEDLREAIEKSCIEADVRVVMLAAEGPDFCAGMDLQMMADTANAGATEFLKSAERLADLYQSLRDHPKPVVAVVHGRALGGGCGLAMACDAVLATESAKFGFPEVNIGFVPAIVMSLLRRTTGEKRAFDLATSGEPIDAREACELGMITRVFPDPEFEASVQTYVASLAAKSTSAISTMPAADSSDLQRGSSRIR
jgi:methylglutaconyl-CoA hydratase